MRSFLMVEYHKSSAAHTPPPEIDRYATTHSHSLIARRGLHRQSEVS